MDYIQQVEPNIILNHTQVDNNGNIYTSYTDVRILLFKYIEYNNLSTKSYIQLDSFLWDLLGYDFTELLLQEKKIVQNGANYCLLKYNRGVVNNLATVILKR